MSTRVVVGTGVAVGVSVWIGVADLGTASVGGGVIVMGPPISGTAGPVDLHADSMIATSKMMLIGANLTSIPLIFTSSPPSLTLVNLPTRNIQDNIHLFAQTRRSKTDTSDKLK